MSDGATCRDPKVRAFIHAFGGPKVDKTQIKLSSIHGCLKQFLCVFTQEQQK